MAENVVETILVKLGLDASSYNQDADKAVKKNEKLNKSIGETDKIVGTVGKTLGKFFSVIATATGIAKLIDDVQRLNDELYHLEKNLGMSSTTIKAWQGASGAMGGSAEGMTSSMKSLNMAMNDFVTMGDTSMLPYMNALGVSMVGTNGKLKDTNDVMLDLADSFSKMDREQAFSIASKMGIDEGTFNTLVQGRKEMEKMIEYQKTMYQSSEAELQVSRDLAKNRALLGQQWESMKTMMGNILMPLFLKVSEVLLGLFDYLQKHQREVKAVFTGLAFIVGAVLTPVLIKAAIAAAAFLAPILLAAAPVIALGAAFGLLYDDYQTWAEGGKSLFDWGAFSDYINNAKVSTDSLKQGFVFLLTGYTDWTKAAEDGKAWLKLKGFIDENGVSLKTLRQGFINLASDMMETVIPTLQGYGSILQKLFKGDFSGAFAEAKEMGGNLWDRIKSAGRDVADRVGGAADVATGQAVGTASGAAASAPANGKPTRGFTAEKGLGSVSAKYEGKIGSANKDVDQNGRPAGWAYGKYQFNSAKGGLQKFFSDNPEIANQFTGLSAGSSEFNKKWQSLAKADPKGFESAQDKSAANLWYNPARDAYKKAGFNLEDRGVQEAIFSSSIQHGGVVRNLLPLIKKQLGDKDISKMSSSDQIKAIYKGRTAYHPRGKGRYDSEMKDALGLSGGAAGAQESMRQGSQGIPFKNAGASVNNRIDTKIGDINVYTTASSITGVAQDAAGAFSNQIGMMTPSLG